MFRKTKTEIPAFYERHPVRSLQWRTTEEGKVVILSPKMGTHRLGVWLSNRMARAPTARSNWMNTEAVSGRPAMVRAAFTS